MDFTYEIKESSRALNARITVHADGRVVVTKPRFTSEGSILRLLRAKQDWITNARTRFERKLIRDAKHPTTQLPRLRRGTPAYKAHIESARMIAHERVNFLARNYGFTHGTISIRNQKSRWGSCSKAGNLSFNYRIVHLPPELVEYLMVHELAHTREHNHSPRFWSIVEEILPEYKKLRRQLTKGYRF